MLSFFRNNARWIALLALITAGLFFMPLIFQGLVSLLAGQG